MANIKILRTLIGEEILGEIVKEDSHFHIKNPCQIGLAMAGPGQPPQLNIQKLLMFSADTQVAINKEHIMYTVSVDPKIEMKYNEIFGNIIVAQPKIVLG